MCTLGSNTAFSNLFILVMKQGQLRYYGKSSNPYHLFSNREEAENFILDHNLGTLWKSAEATQDVLTEYLSGNL